MPVMNRAISVIKRKPSSESICQYTGTFLGREAHKIVLEARFRPPTYTPSASSSPPGAKGAYGF